MKNVLLLVIVSLFATILTAVAAPLGRYQQGTMIRMRMTNCMITHGGFMTAFGPSQAAAIESDCPE